MLPPTLPHPIWSHPNSEDIRILDPTICEYAIFYDKRDIVDCLLWNVGDHSKDLREASRSKDLADNSKEIGTQSYNHKELTANNLTE